MGFFDKIKEGLAKTKKAMANTLDAIFIGGEIDDDFYEELTDCLILADLGVGTATKAVERLRAVAREKRMQTTEEAREYLKMILAEMLYIDDTELQLLPTQQQRDIHQRKGNGKADGQHDLRRGLLQRCAGKQKAEAPEGVAQHRGQHRPQKRSLFFHAHPSPVGSYSIREDGGSQRPRHIPLIFRCVAAVS